MDNMVSQNLQNLDLLHCARLAPSELSATRPPNLLRTVALPPQARRIELNALSVSFWALTTIYNDFVYLLLSYSPIRM